MVNCHVRPATTFQDVLVFTLLDCLFLCVVWKMFHSRLFPNRLCCNRVFTAARNWSPLLFSKSSAHPREAGSLHVVSGH